VKAAETEAVAAEASKKRAIQAKLTTQVADTKAKKDAATADLAAKRARLAEVEGYRASTRGVAAMATLDAQFAAEEAVISGQVTAAIVVETTHSTEYAALTAAKLKYDAAVVVETELEGETAVVHAE